MLRVSPTNWRSYEHLIAELDLLHFLHRHHLLTPQPISQKGGTYIQTLHAPEGPRYAVLFTFVPGIASSPTTMHSHRFGQAIAELHAVTDGYPIDHAGLHFEPTRMLDEPLDRLKPLCNDHPDDFAYLLALAPLLKQAADKLPRHGPEYGICHGDVNEGNFLVAEQGWALLDFEYFGYGWRVFDIGTFFNNQLHQLGPKEGARDVLAAFLAGYQSVRPLSQIELEALPFFVVLRQIWLLGVGAKNLPNIGLSMFEQWVFGQCIPLIKTWLVEAKNEFSHSLQVG
jgi:Ser/Thr protein kinase RdoA (MazF antagonist)